MHCPAGQCFGRGAFLLLIHARVPDLPPSGWGIGALSSRVRACDRSPLLAPGVTKARARPTGQRTTRRSSPYVVSLSGVSPHRGRTSASQDGPVARVGLGLRPRSLLGREPHCSAPAPMVSTPTLGLLHRRVTTLPRSALDHASASASVRQSWVYGFPSSPTYPTRHRLPIPCGLPLPSAHGQVARLELRAVFVFPKVRYPARTGCAFDRAAGLIRWEPLASHSPELTPGQTSNRCIQRVAELQIRSDQGGRCRILEPA